MWEVELPGVRGSFQAEMSDQNLERHMGATMINNLEQGARSSPGNSVCEVMEATENLMDTPEMQDLSQRLVRR